MSARSLSLVILCRASVVPLAAQTAADPPSSATTMFPHPDDTRWWLSEPSYRYTRI